MVRLVRCSYIPMFVNTYPKSPCSQMFLSPIPMSINRYSMICYNARMKLIPISHDASIRINLVQIKDNNFPLQQAIVFISQPDEIIEGDHNEQVNFKQTAQEFLDAMQENYCEAMLEDWITVFKEELEKCGFVP